MRDQNPDRLDDGARAEAEMNAREAHAFTGNGPGVIGADNCQICGKWYDEHPAPQGDDGLEPLYAFFRRGHMFHIHNDRSVFEGWMEKQAWLYPPDECEIVKYLPVIAPSEQAERVPADWYASANEARNAAEAKLASAMEALEPLATEFDRLKKNFEGFEDIFDDDAAYVGGRINIGHLRRARATLSRLKPGEKGGE